MTTVLVTDAARGSAISIIRSLSGRGWRVIAGDSSRAAPGRFSRHTDAWFTYPDPHLDPSGAVRAIEASVERHGVDLVFPVTDDVILPMLERRAELEARCTLALPPTDALRTAADKEAVTALAARLGVPTPRTAVARGGEVPRDLDLGWPVVVKPARSRTLAGAGVVAHDVVYAGDAESLEASVRSSPGTVLLQEYIGGEGIGVEVLARDGRVLVAFAHRRIREYPPSGGASSFRESVAIDRQLSDAAHDLVRELRWTGLAMVEFKAGRDGPRLMEINGRVWGSLPLAVRAGVDFPGLAADVHLARPLPSQRAPRLGVRSRNVDLELRWAAAVLTGHRLGPGPAAPTRRDAFRTLARLALPGDGYDIAQLRDPAPGVVDGTLAIFRLLRKRT